MPYSPSRTFAHHGEPNAPPKALYLGSRRCADPRSVSAAPSGSRSECACRQPHIQSRLKARGLQALIHRFAYSHAGQVYDPSIMAYRPQRMSIASTKSTISWGPQDHTPELRPETRRSSVSSYASYASQNSIYSQAHTTATSMGSRRSSFTTQLKARSTQPLAQVFKGLPPSIYDCILQQLKILHNEQYMQSCATCYQRDLHSLALTSRAWDRAVRPRL